MISLPVAVGHLDLLGHLGRRAGARAAQADLPSRESGASAASAADARTGTFRADIEGLRGLAILFVVLYHSGLVALPGGFVGVDVFFVISGFLITGLLLRERERTGRIALSHFYARRVRRLMPAGLITVAVILLVAAVVVPPLDRSTVSLDGAAAAFSVANIRFAAAEGGYFSVLASPSPFTHFWSLSVEEQFYLVWPALLLLGARGRRPRLGAAIVLGAVFIASLAACLAVTDSEPSWAFYMLPTRAWQLATGGLLAIGAVGLARIPALPMAALGWAGLAALIVAPLAVDPTMAYPGAIALLPTLGAAALIAAGEKRWTPARLLAKAPLRFLGRISYSLYLWHWPILVLPAIAVGAPLEPGVRAGLVAASIVIATLSWAWIEEPFRRGRPRLMVGSTRKMVLAGLALAFVVAVGGDLRYAEELDLDFASASQVDDGAIGGDDIDWTAASPIGGTADDDADAPPDSADDTTEEPDADAVADAPPSPGEQADAAPTAAPTTAPTTNPPPTAIPAVSYALPGNVRPSVAGARTDTERPWRDGCLLGEAGSIPTRCSYGDPKGRFVVALIGDSHASALFPAIQAVARHRGWRLDTYLKVDCPYIDMRVRSLTFKREYRECAAWRAAVQVRIAAAPPDLVVITNSRWIHPVLDDDATLTRQADALARMIARLPGLVAVVVDPPAADRDIPACLSAHSDDIRPCAVPRSTAYSGAMQSRERLAAQKTGARLVNFARLVCPTDPCPAIVRGMIVLRDTHHLTATFARTLAPALDKALWSLMHPATAVSPASPLAASPELPAPPPPVPGRMPSSAPILGREDR